MYLVNLILSAGLILIMVNMMGWASVLLLIIIIPLLSSYMRILSGIMSSMGINESSKNLVALMVLMMLGSFLSEVSYVLGFIFMGSSILGGVLCSVYVFLCVSMGIWTILILYLVPNVGINDNYRVLTLSVIPLLAFFVNICSSWMLLWMVMINAMMLIL